MPCSFVRAALRLYLGGLAAALMVQGAAQADIRLRDEGAEGIALSNLPGADGVTVAAEPTAERPPVTLPREPGPGGKRGKTDGSRARLAPLVSAAAAAHGLPEALLTAVIEVESNFNPGAVSPKGAAGLMQLMPGTARQLGVGDARNPAANVDGGARYLKELLERFDHNLVLALAAYNAGPARVGRGQDVPAIAETRRYVPRVIRRYHSIEVGGATR